MFDKSYLCATKLRTPKPLPFGASTFLVIVEMITSRQMYEMELDANLRMLCVKYPHESALKIKELLEELENSVEMVEALLQEQGAKAVGDVKSKEMKVGIKQQRECQDPEKRMLMKAIVSLYKKL